MACLMTNHPLVLRAFSARSAAPFHSKNPAAFPANVLGPKTSSRSRSLQQCLQKNLVVCCSAPSSDAQLQPFDITLLEHYTQRVPSEILLVHAIVDDEEDEVLVYKGHSSSLMRATSADLEEAVLPPNAIIGKIDRIKGPYNPTKPKYIEEGLSWNQFVSFLASEGF